MKTTYKPHHIRYYKKNRKEISDKDKIKRDLFVYKCQWCDKYFDTKIGRSNHEREHPEYDKLLKSIRRKELKKQEKEK